MSALDPSYVGRLIQVAGKAALIGLRGAELRGITYVIGGSRLHVFARGPVTGFTRLCRSPSLFVYVYYSVRILLKGSVNVFVTCLAGLRPDVLRSLLRLGGKCSDPQNEKSNGCPNIAHGPRRPRTFGPGHDKPRSSLQYHSYSPAHVKKPVR